MARLVGALLNSVRAIQCLWRDVLVTPQQVLEPRNYASSYMFLLRHKRLRKKALAIKADATNSGEVVQRAFDEWGRMIQFYLALIGTGLVPRARRHLRMANKIASDAHAVAKEAGVNMPGIPWHLNHPVRDLVIEEKKCVEAFSKALQKGMAHNPEYLYVTEKDLAGLSEHMRSAWQESRVAYYLRGCKAGSYPSFRIGITKDSFDRLLPHSQNAVIRKKFFDKFQAGFDHIDEYALNLIKARHRVAVALGYRNYAEYECASMSIRTVENGDALLRRVFTEATPHLKTFRKKIEEHATKGNGGRKLEMLDEITYRNILTKEADSWKLSEYMEVEQLLPKLFELLGTAYQVNLEPLRADQFGMGLKSHVHVLKVSDSGSHLGFVYLDLYQSTGWFSGAEQLLAGATLLSPGHVYVALNGIQPPWYSSKRFHYSEIVAMAHEFGHVLHLLLYPGDVHSLGEGDLPIDVVELPSTLTETWVLNPNVMGQLAQNKAGAHASPQLLLPTQRDAWFYARLVQTSNVALRLHDFDPTNTTPTQLRERAVSAWNAYNPNISSVDQSFSPFSEDIGLMIACGADAIGYLLCHINAHAILGKGKNTPNLAKVRPLFSRAFAPLRADARQGKALAPHPFKIPENISILFDKAIRFA